MARAGKGYRYHRVDQNHKQLFGLARTLGGFVLETHQGHKDGVDGFVFTRDKGWAAVEIKTPKGKLSEGQIELQRSVPVLTWREDRDVLKHFGVNDA